MHADMTADALTRPWEGQLTQIGPEPWVAGRGMLSFTGLVWLWYASLILRFTSGTEMLAGVLWLLAMALWLGLQTWIARAHLPERYTFFFFTLLQALLPTLLTVLLVFTVPALKAAAVSVILGVSVNELVAIHVLRLAAWGTIAKYLKGQLPRYFYLFGSLPDFGFAIFAVLFTGWLVVLGGQASETFLLLYSVAGALAFVGASTTMHFGVPGSPISWRWDRVERGDEAPTLLPLRWPMNLAPAFCGSAFWLAHGLLIAKLGMP